MKTKKCIIVICILLGVVALAAGVFVFWIGSNKYQQKQLEKEINRFMGLSFEESAKEQSIKCKGEYGKVEKGIKAYIQEFDSLYFQVSDMLNVSQIGNVVTPENLSEGGPNYEESRTEINRIRKEWDDMYQEYVRLTSKECVMSFLNEGVSIQNQALYYNTLMDADEGIIAPARKDLEASNSFINDLLDVQTEILDLFSQNYGKWQIQDGAVYFDDSDVEARYYELLDKMMQIE